MRPTRSVRRRPFRASRGLPPGGDRMTITEVRVTPRQDPRLRAYVSVVFDESFVIHGIKLIATDEGHLLLAMPNRRRRNGSFQDVAHPIHPEFRKIVEDAVFAEYYRVLRAGRLRPSFES